MAGGCRRGETGGKERQPWRSRRLVKRKVPEAAVNVFSLDTGAERRFGFENAAPEAVA